MPFYQPELLSEVTVFVYHDKGIKPIEVLEHANGSHIQAHQRTDYNFSLTARVDTGRSRSREAKRKATSENASGLSFRELPFVDSFRNQLTVPSEQMLSTLMVIRDKEVSEMAQQLRF